MIDKGFNRIKPLTTGLSNHGSRVYDDGPFIEQLKAQIRDKGPYRLFITITFRPGIKYNRRVENINRLLHHYNTLLFDTDYEDRLKSLEGYAFFEDHASDRLIDQPHVHMLVKHQECLEKYSFDELEDLFLDATDQVSFVGRQVFNDKGLDIQEVTSDGVIGYCVKHMTKKNLNRFKTFGMDGLSDNLG